MPRSRSKPIDSGKFRAWRDGLRGEALAVWFLRAKRYRILKTRYKTPAGEIDIIAERGGVTVFIEVKARKISSDYAVAMEAVHTRRILAASDYFLARHPARYNADQRFDVIFLAPFAWPRHVIDAFQAN